MKRLMLIVAVLAVLVLAAHFDKGSGRAWLRCVAHYGSTDVCAAKAGWDAGS